MSILCGDIRQVAYVVRDARAMMQHLVRTLGIGPFFVRDEVRFDDFQYLGRSSPSPSLTLGLAHSGNLQFEVIQQNNDAPSAYRDFLRNGHEGVQHFCSWFDCRDRFLAGYERLEAAGLECVHEGRGKGLDIRFAYFRSPDAPNAVQYEIAEALVPEVKSTFLDVIRAAARDWDGTNPIRSFS